MLGGTGLRKKGEVDCGSFYSWLVPGLLVVVWYVSVRTGWWPRSLIASPVAVAEEFWVSMWDGSLLFHAYISVGRLIFGFSVGLVIGLLLGSAAGVSSTAARIINPTFQLIVPIPVIAWIPLLIIVFGIAGARIALVAMGTFFLIYFGTVQGIRSVDAGVVELARLYNKTRLELLKDILLPAAARNIMESARLALAIGWILLLAGEVIASSSGLGWLIWDSRNFAQAEAMLVGMIAVGLLGKATDMGMEIIQSRILRWHEGYELE